MKMTLNLEHFSIDSLELMKSELARHVKCEVVQTGTDVAISCNADGVKCMIVIAVADKFIPDN